MNNVFNLKKIAEKKVSTINEKKLEGNRNALGLSIESQDIVGKNINLSLPKKEIDNTVPFNQQLNKSRNNKDENKIIESKMSKKIVNFEDKDKKQIMDINVKTQEYDTEKDKQYKEAEQLKKKDTDFWDKFVGLQLEQKMKKVDNNIPSEASQLQNCPSRFKEKEINKMVMASIKDADAMLFHIYATAYSQNRDLSEIENQQVADINSGKSRLLNDVSNMGDPVIKEERGMFVVKESNGDIIETFSSIDEARASYPEADVIASENKVM